METTLYNKHGRAVAYIAEDGETIYTWDGRAVGYLQGERLVGWNGKQLGWFTNGTVFDIFGFRAGFIRKKSPIPTEIEPVKSAKQVHSIRGARQSRVAKPVMCYGYSERSLEAILEEGWGSQ